MVQKTTKSKSKDQKGFWWWFLIIVAVLIILNFLSRTNKIEDYTNCVEDCKGDLYCLSYDTKDLQGNYYTSNLDFESCRNAMFSCLDSCGARYGN